MFDKVINPSGPTVFFVERSLISNEISLMEMGQAKAIFEPVFINWTLSSDVLLPDYFHLVKYGYEVLFQPSPLVTFAKLVIVEKVLPHSFDLHKCTMKSEEQESLENGSKRSRGLPSADLLINGRS